MPLKNFSHNGANETVCLIKNINAIFDVCLGPGNSFLFGVIEALHNNSSSLMSCISLGGLTKSRKPTLLFNVLLALERLDNDDDDDNGEGSEGGYEEVERENCVSCRLNEKFFEWKVIMIPKVRPIAKKRM